MNHWYALCALPMRSVPCTGLFATPGNLLEMLRIRAKGGKWISID